MERTLTLLLALFLAVGCVEDAPEPSTNSQADAGTTDDAGPSADGSTTTSPDASDAPEEFDPSTGPVRTMAGLLAYFPFRNDEQFADEAGDNDRTLPNDGAVIDGTFTLPVGGLEFPQPSSLTTAVLTSRAYTLEAWVRSSTNTLAPVVQWNELEISKESGADDRFVPLCVFRCFTDDALTVDDAMVQGQMQHIVVTGDEDTTRLYVDGGLVAAWTEASNLDSLFAGVPKIKIGSDTSAYGFGLLALYDRQLSPGEVLNHTLVGPNPTPEQEQPDPITSAISVVSDGRIHDGQQRAKTLVSDQPSGREGLALEPDRAGLFYLSHEVDTDAELLASRLQLRSFVAPVSSSGTFDIQAVAKRWSVDVGWSETGAGDTWGSPGAAGEDDVFEIDFEEVEIVAERPVDIDLPIGSLVWEWQREERDNHGWRATCGDCVVGFPAGPDATRAPRLVSLLSFPRDNMRPESPSNIDTTSPDTSLIISWDEPAPGVFHEVYINGRLVKRTANEFVEIPWDSAGNGDPEVVVIAVDRWGRSNSR